MVERKDTEENLDDVSPIETGLTFDKWLAQKLRVKRIQKELKKKEAQLITNEYATKLNHFCVELKLYIQLNQNRKEEIAKETMAFASDPETNNVWMKDYNKTPLFPKSDANDLLSPNSPRKAATFQPKNKLADLSSSFNSSSTGKLKSSTEIGNVYKGMSYEEWTKIRDQFLKSHNML